MGLPCWQPYFFDDLLEKSWGKSQKTGFWIVFFVKSHENNKDHYCFS